MKKGKIFRLLLSGSAAAAFVLACACKAPPIPGAERELEFAARVEVPPAGEAPAVEIKGTVEIPEMSAEVGDVERGVDASHVFVLRNKTDRQLHIKRVRGS
jgi:hypothetical protein